MRRFIRLCMGECYKTKHTIIPALHIGIPLAGSMVLLLYYRASGAETIVSLSTFTQLTGLAFPFIVSLVCACQTGLEEGNHFQNFLGGSGGWLRSFWAKCLVLQIAGGLAVVIGMGSFALGERYLLGNVDIPSVLYVEIAAGLWLGSLVQYPIHLFLNMRFSQSVSMGIGVIQSVLAALLITGLGEGIWQFLPCSWSIRFSAEILKRFLGLGTDFGRGIFGLISIGVCAIISLWVQYRGELAAASIQAE